jgi:predicted enzyme related to lactoylglutathione lyase
VGLSEQFVQPAIAVSDLARARDFYERQLGLSEPQQEPGGVRYSCGRGSRLFVYESPETAGKAEHTVAGWYVDDLLAVMRELTGRGVTFERYEKGTPTDDDGVFVTDRFRAAWVRDPDGNTLAFQEMFDNDTAAESRDDRACPVVHVEVRGPDPELLRDFYTELAGWSYNPEAAGANVVAQVSEPGRYGFVDPVASPEGPGVPAGVGGGAGHAPYAIFYLGVPDVEAAMRRAEELGGRREMGPQRAAGRNLVVGHIRDPQGNLIGLAGPASD